MLVEGVRKIENIGFDLVNKMEMNVLICLGCKVALVCGCSLY